MQPQPLRMNQPSFKITHLVIGFLAALFWCSWNIWVSPINQWDESRLAINALEMYEHGWSVVTTYLGEPDHWNTKPPLMIWLQNLSLHVFGVHEWALRVPSILATISLAFYLLFFVQRMSDSRKFAWLTFVVFLLTPAFMRLHVARSGDYDALLSLFVTVGALEFYKAIEFHRPKKLLTVFLFFTLAVFTKGIAGLLFGPALVMFALLRKQLLPLLRSNYLWIGLFQFTLCIVGIYWWRNSADPGYWEAVLYEELGGRFTQVVAGNGESPTFYLTLFFDYRQYSSWFFVFVAGVFLAFRKTEMRPLGLFVLIISASLLAILSKSATKFDWYQAVIFPSMSLMTAYALYRLLISNIFKGLKYGFIFLLFAYPTAVIIEQNFIKDVVGDWYPITKAYQLKWQQDEQFYKDLYLFRPDPGEIDRSRDIFYFKRAQLNGYEAQIISFDALHPGMQVMIQTADLDTFSKISGYTLTVVDSSVTNSYIYTLNP